MTRLARITDKLDLKEFQLRSLLGVTKAINNNESTEGLLALFKNIIHEELGITRLTLYQHRDDHWQRVMAIGVKEEDKDIDVGSALGEFKDIQMIGSASVEGLKAFDVAVPVYHRKLPLAFLLLGDIDEEEHGMSPTVKHLNFIQTLTNVIMVALENKRLAQQELLQERAKRELELAAEIQNMLIPQSLPNNDFIDVAAWYQPHSEVGGDYYDLIELPSGEVVFCVADVSGKGIPAAMLMSNFQAALRALVQYTNDPLDHIVHDLNNKVFKNAQGDRFITFFIGRYDPSTRKLQYVNAGHNPPVLEHGPGHELLRDGAIGLGMMPELPFLNLGCIDIPKGAALVCYTDGIEEQENAQEVPFGTDRMISSIKRKAGSSTQVILDHLIESFEAHRGGSAYLDDIAVLVCRFL